MQENQYEKIKVLFLKLIEETKELSEAEFEKVLIQVFKENPFSDEVKDRLVIDIAKMREKIVQILI
jgi:predicted TIM-barrel enzyme